MAATIDQTQISRASRSAIFNIGGLRAEGESRSVGKSFNTAVRTRPVIMVCWSGSGRLRDELLRKAMFDAAVKDADCYVVNVEVPTFHFATSTAERRRTMASQLRSTALSGAKIVFLRAHDVARALLDFAWDARANKIIIGRSRPGILHRLFSPSVTKTLLKRARDVEIEVVGYRRKINSPSRESYRAPKRVPTRAPVADFRKPEYSR